jgi:GntR family transcriptional regulator, vanillate catabolism transcriptional regulator
MLAISSITELLFCKGSRLLLNLEKGRDLRIHKRTPIERIFSEVFRREMTAQEFDILVVEPAETRNSNEGSSRRTGRRAKTSIVTIDKRALRVSSSQISKAVMGLREMLLRGEFRPGGRIAEDLLSSRLGVDRMALRLAFERLVNEGLIKALPESGFAAGEFSIDDVWETIETRSILEGAAARLAAERLKKPQLLEPARKINRTMEDLLKLEVEDFADRYLELNKDFHAAIVELANNQVLRRATERIWMLPFASPGALVLLYKTVPASKAMIPIAQEHHRAIIEAIENGDGARAYGLAYEHANLTRRNLEFAMGNREILRTIPGASLLKLRTSGKV